jgi:LPXTG-motif cell wall-anchored protein
MHEADKKLINAQWVLLGLVLLVGALTFYIYLRRKKEEAIEIEHQMLKEYPLNKNKKVMPKCFK